MNVKYPSIQHLRGRERKVAEQRLRRAGYKARGLTIRGRRPVRQQHPELIGLSWRERNNYYVRALRLRRKIAGLTHRGFIFKQRRPVAFRGRLNTQDARSRHAALVAFYRFANSFVPKPTPPPKLRLVVSKYL